jgi:tetratricopeptide (TPR) repeat protein
VTEAVTFLELREWVRRQPSSRLEGDEEFVFRHALIREVAYATLPKAVRRERHAAIARFLETAYADRAGSSEALLAHHWLAAGDAGRALDYLLLAAERAGRAWAKAEAVALYARAVDLVPGNDAPRRREIRLRSALLLADSGDYPAAKRELDALLPELAGRDEVRALVACSRAAHWLMDPETARRHAARAAEVAQALGDEELRVMSVAQHGVSLSAIATRTRDGIEEGEAALTTWPQGAIPTDRAMLLGAALGVYHYWVGDYESAERRGREGYELSSEIRYVDGLLLGGSHLGLALAGLGRHEEALKLYRRVVAQGMEMERLPRFTARCVNAWAGCWPAPSG